MVLPGFVKFLGGLVIALLVLGIILGVAGFLAVRNLDPNMFRTEFEKYLAQQTGFRVELGEIKFQWRPQPQLQVAGFTLYHPQSLEKVLQSEQVRIDADLASIWQKHFNISQIVIQNPEIFIKRGRGGVWNWQVAKAPLAEPAPKTLQEGLIPTAEASEGSGNVSLKDLGNVAQGWKFGVGKILIRGATVHFVDETVQPAYKLEIENLETEILQKEPNAPFHFTASATLFNAAKRNLDAEGALDLRSRSLDLVLRYGPEKAMFKGLLKAVGNVPDFEGSLEVRDLDIESVTPSVYKNADHLTGRLTTKTQLSFQGANPDSIKRSLKGQGTLEIKDGALRNRNLVKEVFDRLSPVLAITSALGGELPPELNEMLKDRDTPFQSLRAAYNVQSGLAKMTGFQLVHPNYQLTGQGTYGVLDQRIDGSMQLLLSSAISAYLVQKIHEMQFLADRSGQVLIPFRYSGVFPDTAVQPDLPYITSRLMQSGAEQLLNRGLEQLSKYLERKKK